MVSYQSSPTSSDILRLAGTATGAGLTIYGLTNSNMIPQIQEKLAPVGQFIDNNPYVLPAALGTAVVGSLLINNNKRKRLERGY